MHTARSATACVALFGLLASACGGGGSDGQVDPSKPTVIYRYASINDVAWDDEAHRAAYLLFEVSPAPSADPTVEIVDGGGFFSSTPSVYPLQDGTYVAFFPYPDDTAAGTHTGSVTLRICPDAACARPYDLPQAALSYEVIVFHVETGLPPITATFSIDGAAASGVTEGIDAGGDRTYSLPVKVGQVVAVTASEQPWTVSYLISPVTLTGVAGMSPAIGFTIVSLASGVDAATLTLDFRVADGRRMHVALHVTR